MSMHNKQSGAQQSVSPGVETAGDDFSELFQKVEFPTPEGAERAPVIMLRSGRKLTVDEDREGELITVSNPQGETEISLRLTPAGPVLHVQAAAIALRTPGEMTIDCGALHLRTAGDLTEDVGGEMRTHIEGKAAFAAHTIDVNSHRGDITVKANDDVCLLGERIKLNS